jgi:hypothetical protein
MRLPSSDVMLETGRVSLIALRFCCPDASIPGRTVSPADVLTLLVDGLRIGGSAPAVLLSSGSGVKYGMCGSVLLLSPGSGPKGRVGARANTGCVSVPWPSVVDLVGTSALA